MLDRLKAFISGLQDDPRATGAPSDDPRVAAAALMFHVIDADGVREDAERERLRELLAHAYQLSGRELDRLVEAGEEAEREAVDLFASTSVLNRTLDEGGKVEFIAVLWELVYADGSIHELEDNIVWRVAELIGVSQRDRVLMRQMVRKERGLASDGNDD